MIVISVARKPIQGSVANNIRQCGVGGINIDGSRISFASETDVWTPSTSTKPIYKGYMDGSGEEYKGPNHRPTLLNNQPHNGGRWPANVILEHAAGCKRAGLRQVKCGVSGAKGRGWQTEYVGGRPANWKDAVTMTYNGADGKETIPAWDCQPGCPVALMDIQSGSCPSVLTGRADPSVSHGHPSKTTTSAPGVTYMPGKAPGSVVYADAGGASRFFKQVGGDK